jgi:uroporphyrin-3 C-methyltransferase
MQNKGGSPAKTASGDKTESTGNSSKAVTADAAVVVSERPESKNKSSPSPTKSKKPSTLSYTALLALGISLVLATAVFYIWQQQTLTTQNLLQQIELQQENINSKLETQSSKFSSIETKHLALYSDFEHLGQAQKQLSQAFRDLLNANRHLKQDWLISEAEYLLNLAGQRLSLMRDVKTALTALKAADRRLSETGNPELLSIRKALSKDINQLEAVHQADLSGLSFKLSAMLSDIDNLKLLTPKPEGTLSEQNISTAADIKDWKELPAAMWHEIQKLVVIREHNGPIKPLLAPEQNFFLSQNLKLQLEQARLAMLSGETQIYIERLNTAKSWITKWYDGNHSKTINLLAQLDNLLSQTIHPTLPTLNNSFAAFKSYHKNINLPESVKSELKAPVTKPKSKKPASVKKSIVPPQKSVEKKPAPIKQQPEKAEIKPPPPVQSNSTQVPL